MQLLDYPDQVILLRDQLAMVEYAVAEVGDAALSLRLSLQAGFRSLGPLADYIAAAPTFEAAIHRCNLGIGPLLQSATQMKLGVRGGVAAWSYRISDPATVGRRHNELLALGYMTDILRHFAGHGTVALRVALPGRGAPGLPIQELLGCDVTVGACATMEFDARCLALPNPVPRSDPMWPAESVPEGADLLAGVTQLMRLAALEDRPTLTWMARRLRMARRTLQRRLHEGGSSFEALRERELMHRAAGLLEASRMSISDIAFELGYSAPAQFTRAAIRWSGLPPRTWRFALRDTLAGAKCKESAPLRP